MADCKDYGFMTRALHAGWDCDPATGALGLPIYATAAYQFHDGAHAERLFNLEEEGFTYSRIANPTVKAFEDTLASLESGVGAVALASGQAALSHIAAALCEAGTNVVLSRKVYGGTLTFLQNLLTRFGVEVIMVDGDHPCQVEQAINDETRAIFTETIGNPIINVAPLEALSRIARRQGVPLVVDNTFASPALCRPIEWGAHIVFHSTTKYISGFGNLVGGAVIDGGNFDWAAYPDKFPGLAKPDAGYHGVTFTERFIPRTCEARRRIPRRHLHGALRPRRLRREAPRLDPARPRRLPVSLRRLSAAHVARHARPPHEAPQRERDGSRDFPRATRRTTWRRSTSKTAAAA